MLPPALPRFASWSLPPGADLPLSGSATPAPLPDPDDLANPGDVFPLSASQRAMLASAGFVVLPTPYPTLEAVYADAAAERRPVLITADLLLATTAAAVAATWDAVAPQLEADLQALLTALQPLALSQWRSAAGDPALLEAARAHAAYLSVAAALLGLPVETPPEIAPLVADELTLIRRADGVFRSPVQGYETDYGAFAGQPAGTQALLWLSRLDFRLDGEPGAVRRQARQVLLLRAALEESGNRSRWERLDVALGYFWGEPAGLTVADVDAIARAVFGAALLPTAAQLDIFIATARQFGQSMRFLPFTGERHSPLAEVSAALTFNRVGAIGADQGPAPLTGVITDIGLARAVAHPLDGAAALGSARALALLQAAGETRYEGYSAQLAVTREALAARPEATWTRTLPDAWVYATVPLLGAPAPGWPAFMQSEAWGERQLWAWLGAQLLPAVAETAPAGEPFGGAQVAYVEPQAALYARLAALVGQLQRGAAARGLVEEAVLVRLTLWEAALVQLARISLKQPAGIGLTPEESALLSVLGQRLGAATAPGTRGPLASPGVALVELDRASGVARYDVLLEALPLYALVPFNGTSVVAVGAIWSTTTLFRAGTPPLTAAAWSGLPETERGERPLWTNRFTAPLEN